MARRRHRGFTVRSRGVAMLAVEVLAMTLLLVWVVLRVVGGLVVVGLHAAGWARSHPGESALGAVRDALGAWVDEVNETGSWFGRPAGDDAEGRAWGDGSSASDWSDWGGGGWESDAGCASDAGGGCGDW